jgi:non-ribosomal peptide synthetase component F
LDDAANVVFSALDHATYPFELLVEQLNPERDASYAPLFQIFLVLLDEEKVLEKSDELDAAELEMITNPHARYDIRLEINRSSQGLRLAWQYSAALFDASYIEGFADAFNLLVERMTTEPGADVYAGGLVRGATRDGALKPAYGNIARIPGNAHWLARLDETLRSRPDAIAVKTDCRSLTYSELDCRVRGLVAKLAELGVRHGDAVGVRTGKNEHFVVAMLAMAYFGATFCPIHEDMDDARVVSILESAGVTLLLVDEERRATSTQVVRHLCMTEVEPASATQAGVMAGDFPAVTYVLHTSGSTGVPKGVPISGASLANYLDFASRYYFDGNDGAILITSPYFDISMPALWLPLLTGKTLDIPAEGEGEKRLTRWRGASRMACLSAPCCCA